MSYGVYSNLEAIEDSVDGTKTCTLKRKSRQIILTNDSGGVELKFKFNDSEDFATLKPTETVSMHVHVRDVILNSPSAVPYRLWVYG